MKIMRPLIGVNMDFKSDDDFTDVRRDKYFVLTQYLDLIHDCGGVPLPVPCFDGGKSHEAYLDLADGFLFVGGADYPPDSYGEENKSGKNMLMSRRRYENDLALASAVMKRGFPVFGICAGAQLLNIAAGGKLIQDIDSSLIHTGGVKHEVKINGGKILTSLFGQGKVEVNSFHHQAIDPSHVGNGFAVTAASTDGTVEAIESESDRFMLGVQWHPERMSPGHSRRIFTAFVKACMK